MATQSNNSRRTITTAMRVSSENTSAKGTHLNKKRPPLTNLTNHHRLSSTSTTTNTTLVPCAASKSNKLKKSARDSFSSKANATVALRSSLPKTVVVPPFSKANVSLSPSSTPPVPVSMDISPTPSMDESISTCDSLRSPEVEYLDGTDVAGLVSLEKKTSNNLHICDPLESAGSFCKREILAEMEVVNVDDNYMDPQFCSTIACDIYKHLRESETLKRPSTDFMEKIQKDINVSMRAILVDWLVEVAEEYRLVPDTLYLTVNYIDRFLSGNAMNRQRLQLLGVACMMIAAKYEEICAPQVEEFCYITDNTYFKEEVLQMESAVLNFLKFEMTAPTTKCFLRRFVRAAQVMDEVPSMQLECLANYVAELSLLEYNMLQYTPSLMAASAVFLAKYILIPSRKPWNSTLQHYTLYEPSDLECCVKSLHQLCLNSHSSSLPAIREKYSQHKYKFVAKKYCPPSIPSEYFYDSTV